MMKRSDLQWTTYDIGRFKSGYVTHYPSGLRVDWYTNKEQPSEWRAREAAEAELEKLVNDQTQKNP